MTRPYVISVRHGCTRLFWVFVLAFVILATYQLQIAESNAYAGYVSFAVDASFMGRFVASLLLLSLAVPVRIAKPSDCFRLLYGLFVLLPYVVLHEIRGAVPLHEYVADFCILALPVFLMAAASYVVPAVRMPAVFRQEYVICLLVLLCLLGLANALSAPTPSAGFGLDVYARRLEGRELFPDRSFFAYLNAAIVNGFAPLLAFIAGWRRKLWPLLLSAVCVIGYYYILGLKVPVIFVSLSLALGWAARMGKLETVGKVLCALLLGLFALFLFEYLMSGFSYTADYFFRRAYGVPAFLMAAYFDFMAAGGAPLAAWSALDGVHAAEPITFVVGERFLGDPGLNANTNTFLYALADGGVVLYGATVLLVLIVFLALDAAYRSRGSPVLLYLGFLYAILLTEQAATIALVSSGIGVLIMFFLFSRAKQGRFGGRRPSY